MGKSAVWVAPGSAHTALTRNFVVEVMGLEPTTSTLRMSPDGSDTVCREQRIRENVLVDGQLSFWDLDRS